MPHIKTIICPWSSGGVMNCLVVMVTSSFVVWFQIESCIHMGICCTRNPTEHLLFPPSPSACPALRPHVCVERLKHSRKDFNQSIYLEVSRKIFI